MFKNILVSVGEADQGRQAVRLAQRIGEPEARITLTRIHGAYAVVGRGGPGGQRNAQKRLADVVLRRALLSTGIAEGISHGAPSFAQGMTELAAAQRADLIVLGSSWATQPGQLALDPNLTRTIAASAPCAVAIAPAAAGPGTQDPLRRIGVGFDGGPESVRALAVARRFATQRQAGLIVFESESAPRSGANSYGEGSVFRPLETLRALSQELDLLVMPSRLAGARRRIGGGTSMLEDLATSAFAPMLIVTRHTVTPQVVGVAAPAEYWSSSRR